MVAIGQDPNGWKKVVIEEGVEEAPPGPGWERIEAAETGIEFEGAWERVDGKGVVAVGNFQEMPDLPAVLGMRREAVDPSQFPVRVKSLEAPLLGMRFWFDEDGDGWEERERMFLMGESGGKVFAVELKPKAGFDPKLWGEKGEGHPDDKVLRAQFEAKAAEMTMLIKNPPKIGIDTKLVPAVADATKAPLGDSPRLTVEVGVDGSFAVDGEVRDEAMLLKLMAAAVEADPDCILHIRAAKETKFVWVRKLIRLGAKAGMDQVAYGVLKKE